MALPAIVALMIVSKDVVAVFLGPHWAPAVPMFAVLGVTALLHTTYLTTAWLFVSLGRTGRQLRWSLIAVPVTIAGIAAGFPWAASGSRSAIPRPTCSCSCPGYGTRPGTLPCESKRCWARTSKGVLIAAGVGVVVYLVSLVPLSNVYGRLAIEAAAGLVAWSVLSLVVSGKDSPLRRLVGLASAAGPGL